MSAGRGKIRTDKELLEATVERKERGEQRFPEFSEFCLRNEGKARARARGILKNQALAEDALQEAKLKMFRFGLDAKKPAAYYRTTVKTCALDVREREFRHAGVPIDAHADGDARPALQLPADDSYRPDRKLKKAQRNACLGPVVEEAFRRLLKKSPRKVRVERVLRMRYGARLSVKDIAKKLQISTPNAVSQIIRRGLRELGRILSVMKNEGYPGAELLEDGEVI